MPRPARNRLTPWIESLILSYSVPEEDEEDEEEQQGVRSRGQLRAHVVGVNHMSESQAQLQSCEDPTGLLYLSDGQLQIPAVLTAAAWERLQDQEDRECFTSLLNSTVCIQDYRLLFHVSPEETRCRFFLSVGQLATVAAGPVKDKPPCCSTLNSVQAKIRLTWRTLRGQEDSESQDGHELTVLLDEWQRDVLEELKQDIRRRLNPRPSTSSHPPSPPLHTTGWDLDRVRYKGEESFSVPMRCLLVPEDTGGGTMGEAQQQRSGSAMEVWEDAKSSPPAVKDRMEKTLSRSPPAVEDRMEKPSSRPPPAVEDRMEKPLSRPPPAVEDRMEKTLSRSPPAVGDRMEKPSSRPPPAEGDRMEKPSSRPPPAVEVLENTRSSSLPVKYTTEEPSSSSSSAVVQKDTMEGPSSRLPAAVEVLENTRSSFLPVKKTMEKPSSVSPSPLEDILLSEEIVLSEDLTDKSSVNPWDMFPPLDLSPSSSEASEEPPPPPNPEPAAVHSSKESSFLPAYQKQPSAVVQTATSSSATPTDEASVSAAQTLLAMGPDVEETVERKSRNVKRKRSDPSPEALRVLVEEELSASPPSWLFDSQAGSQESSSSSRISSQQTTAPAQRRTPSMHSDSSPFSYSYQVSGQNLMDLSRFRVASSLLQWSLKYLLNPDHNDKTPNV